MVTRYKIVGSDGSASTNNAIARFDGTGGNIIQNSAVTIADTTGDIITPGFVDCDEVATGNIVTGDLTVNNDLNVSTINVGYSGLKLSDVSETAYLFISYEDSDPVNRFLGIEVNGGNRSISLTGNLTVPSTATVSGTNTGDQTSVSGNAGTVTVADAASDTTTWVLLGTSQTGNLSPATDSGLTYNASTDVLTATNVSTTNILDTNANELIKFTTTASAVNELTVTNAATGNSPTISITGGDTNPGLNLTTKGSGAVVINSSATAQQSTITSGLVVNNAGAANAADGFIAKGSGLTLFQTDATTNTITAMAKVTNYNAIATVTNGIPSLVAQINLTAQGAAIATNTIYAVPASGVGMYRISWVATITRAATTSSVLGGTNGFQVTFTNNTDSVAKTSVAGLTVTSAANTTTTMICGHLEANCKASTNLQYSFDYTSIGATTMQFDINIRVEAI